MSKSEPIGMHITFSDDLEDILFSILYINLPLTYTKTTKPNTFELSLNHLNGSESKTEVISGVEKVLRKINELCRCEPHDLLLINEKSISEAINVHKQAVKNTLFKILKNQNDTLQNNNKASTNENSSLCHILPPDVSINEPSSFPSTISETSFLNGLTMTIADLVLFAKCYKAYKNGSHFSETELVYLKNFQDGLLQKKVPIRNLFQPCIMDIKIQVGLIKEIQDHPTADKLFVEKVDFGDSILTICSGLRSKVKPEDLLNNKFLFVTNLKKTKLRGVTSEGMILCAKDEYGKIEPLKVPDDIAQGTIVSLDDNFDSNILISNHHNQLDAKSSVFQTALGALSVKKNVLLFNDQPLSLEGRKITALTANGTVS